MAITLGDYLILTQRSVGADGVSYWARQRSDGRHVEIRELEAAMRTEGRWPALAKRIRTCALIGHPAAARVLEFVEDPARPFVVMERTDSEPLGPALRDRVPLPEIEAIPLVRAMTGALGEAHRLGLAHGAIGLGSIRISGKGLLLDFTGVDVGDPVAVGGDPASDVNAVGAVLHWLLTGQEAAAISSHSGFSDEVTLIHSESSQGEADSDPAVALDRLVRQVLNAPPADRPSARELASRLDAIMALLQPHAQADTAETLVRGTMGFLDESSAAVIAEPEKTSGDAPELDLALGSRTRLGRYRLLEKLGQGGMGAVYRGEDLADGTVVALKVLRPEYSDRPAAFRRFQKEARLLGEVNNPFVTNLLEVNEDDGIHYLVMDFVAGRTLGQRLEEKGKLDEAEALSIIADVARALVDAHERGIVHRDIKPANILLSEDEGGIVRVRLSDFGLARHVEESESLQLTQAHAVVGTPQYMAPEQGGGGPIDPRTDVYAMGVTLFHMLAGKVPFQASRLMDLIALHTSEPPPPLQTLCPSASDGACRIVERALAKAPDARYPDAAALLVDVDRILRGELTPEAAHPKLPDCDPRELLQFDFTWELEASPRQLWPLVTNTERLNHAIGLPPVTFRTETDPATGKVRRFGEAHQGGMAAVWEEHPFEWVEPRRMGVLRDYHRGPFKWMVSSVQLTPRARGGTTLTHFIRIAPRGRLTRMAASLKVGRDSKRALERVYKRIDASLTGKLSGEGAADPFEEPAPLSQGRRKRLERLLAGLVQHGVNPSVVERFGAFLASAPAQEVTRIRPLALARRLGLDSSQVVSACLHGARDGLLVLLWDILCPVCRVPSEVKDTLRALRDHGQCEACRIDYELDFAHSVEMIFRVHPEVREADLGVYCIGGPSHSPHVVAQVRVDAAERIELELGMSEGTYQLRGPQLPFAMEFRVEPSSGLRRLDLDLHEGPSPTAPRVLRAGGQVLSLANGFDQEIVVRIERTASRDDALTAARASSLALFRELFPGEILSPGQLIGISTTTLLITALEDTDALYADQGDARAFAVIHEHVRLLDDRIRREGGALVKTVGEGVLAAFPESAMAVRVGLDLAEILAAGETTGDLRTRAGVHRGPAMAATINDHLDYFGLTVAQTAALLKSARPGDLVLSQAVASEPAVMAALRARRRETEVVSADLPGAKGSIVHRLGQ